MRDGELPQRVEALLAFASCLRSRGEGDLADAAAHRHRKQALADPRREDRGVIGCEPVGGVIVKRISNRSWDQLSPSRRFEVDQAMDTEAQGIDIGGGGANALAPNARDQGTLQPAEILFICPGDARPRQPWHRRGR